MSDMIKLENVIKMYGNGRRAVNGVNLCVRRGECVVICGAPGSGKTTLMRLIAGMERPSSGKVLVLDKAVHEMDAEASAAFRNRYIGLLPRDAAFMDSLTVLDNVALPLTIRGVSLMKREKAAKEQLKTLGLTYVAGARPQQLSLLEAKLVSIARMLIAQPEVLLLDDVTADLSARDAEQVEGILRALSNFGDCTLLEFSGAHNGQICADRTNHLERGKIQEETEQ